MKQLKGIIPALFTPFDDQQQVDLKTLAKLINFHLKAGVGGFYLTGSTGEWFRLTIDERKKIFDVAVQQVAGTVPVVAHVGHFSTKAAIELTEHAKKAGADFVSSLSPAYYTYTPSIDEIHDYYKAIADIGLPVIVYYIQAAGGFTGTKQFVEKIASIDGVIGLKYTGSDLYLMESIIQLNDKLSWWAGYDQMALTNLNAGATGLIGSNYNYIPEIYIELYNAQQQGNIDLAKQLQKEANTILRNVKTFGPQNAYKQALKLRGLDIGDYRLPYKPLTTQQKQNLEELLKPFKNRFSQIS